MSVASHTAAGLAGRVAATGLGFVSSLLIARTLGPEGNGAYGLLLLVHMLVLTFGNAGIGVANTVFLAKGRYPVGRLVGTSVSLALLLGAAAVLLLASALLDLRAGAGIEWWSVGVAGALMGVMLGQRLRWPRRTTEKSRSPLA